MELKDEQVINAPRDKVYAALNDPDILKQAIPGCESLTKLSDTEMEAVAQLKIGPVKAKFKGHVNLTDLNPPESYTIVGEGKGGAAGFAKGRAEVMLIEEGERTRLRYNAKADVGGKLAQLGSRLIDSTAQKLASQFFQRFGELVGGEAPPQAPPEAMAEAGTAAEPRTAAVGEPVAPPRPAAGAVPAWMWLAAAAALAAVALYILL